MTTDYTLREYLAHLLIGTPFQRPAEYLRYLTKIKMRWKHPELKEIYLEPSRTEQMMTRLIQNPMNCIDVGCHIGSVLSRILQLSPHGNHIAIEPVPYKAQWLRRKFPNVEVHELALGEISEGEATFFYYPHKSGFSGLKLKPEQGNNKRTFTVRCERLDDIVPSDKHIDFIKLDVVGGELDVLLGAQKVLQRCQPHLLLECTRSGLTSFNLTPSEIFNFLTQQQHYSVFLIKDWLGGKEPLKVEQFSSAIMQYPFKAFNFLATKVAE